jgi:dienelactone hydrolase
LLAEVFMESGIAPRGGARVRLKWFFVLATALDLSCSAGASTNNNGAQPGLGGAPNGALNPMTKAGTGGAAAVPPLKSGTGGAPGTLGPMGPVGGGAGAPGGVNPGGGPGVGQAGAGGPTMGGGMAGMSGGGMAGATGGGGMAGASGGPPVGMGMCCSDGNCLCHGPAPTALTSMAGPYKTAMYTVSTGTIYYPMDADPPLAAIAIIPGFLNTGPEMAPWGPFYASWGFVLETTSSGAADTPDIRAGELLAAVKEMKAENTKMGSPIFGKLSDRFGTTGYSMGGGGTTMAASMDSTLKTSIGLAAWGGTGQGTMVPSLLFCGDADTVAPCNMSDPVYQQIPMSTPKMEIVVPGATHFNWFDPADAGGGMSGKYALAFQKVFLEGDTRWKPLLVMPPAGAMQTTNIQ